MEASDVVDYVGLKGGISLVKDVASDEDLGEEVRREFAEGREEHLAWSEPL